MPDPTPSQREAIRTLEKNLLVSAGAGSGKTWVLVSRFLRMVAGDDGPDAPVPPTAPVDGVLTITFTDKAAGEMRERIAAGLAGRGLVAERRQLEIAYISTIHGFCRRLLQENPFEAALDPQFSTLDGGTAGILRDTCFENVIERAFTGQERDLIDLILVCQEAPSQASAEDSVAGLRKPVLAAMDAMCALGWATGDLQPWIDAGVEGVLARVAALVGPELAQVWDAAVALGRSLRDFRLSGPAEETRQHLNEWAREATSIAEGESLAALAGRAGELRALRPFTAVPRMRREYDARAYSELKEVLQQLRPLLEGPLVNDFHLEREEAAARQALAFLRLVLAVWQQYEKAKEDLSALDFNDLQDKARRLLSASEGIRRRYQRKFRYVMVDEFQDTDRLQKGIIDLLRGDDNFFVVGDVKQSIYGWRNADVRLFLGLDAEFTAKQVTQPERYRRLPLAENFRSRPEILGFVNGVFQEVWRPDSGDAIPFEALEARAVFDAKAEPSVEILLAERGSAPQRRFQEAEMVARRLVEMHGTLPLTSHRRGSDTVRWCDCLILLRSFSQLSTYEDALVRQGIPYFVVGGRGYYARREIRDLLCLLRTIRSPQDDVATAAVLRSPFVGVSLDTLTLLSRQAKSGPRPVSLFRTIKEVWDDPEIPAEDGAALRRFHEMVERLRGKADRVKPGWLLDQALAETHYDARILTHKDGRRRLANVRKLVQMANSFPSPDVAGLVRHLESLSEVSTDEGDAPSYSEAADVVRVMSVHKAKGLEAPVVFLPDLGRQIRARPPELTALEPEEQLIGMKVAEGGEWKPSVALSFLGERRAEKERAEEERLLYVATTRAQEHLVLAGPMPPGSDTWGEMTYGFRLPFATPPAVPQEIELPGIDGLRVRVSGPPAETRNP